MSSVSKYVVFKPVTGGYVCRPPGSWVFGAGVHLLANESQKAAIIKAVDSVPLLPILGGCWVTLSMLFGTAAVWATRSPSHGARELLIATAIVFSLYGASLICRRVLLARLKPIIAGLPPTDERITTADVRKAAPPVVLSPTRQLILKTCFALMPFILVALVVSRAVDMQEETHQPLLQALYDANANPAGLTSILNLGVLLFFGFRFLRHGWPGQKPS
jgi:hypothetical protein